MNIYRKRHFQNGQMWLGFSRTPPGIPAIARLALGERHVRGEPLIPLVACSPNNWMRRLLYFFGAPRSMTRRV